MCQYFPGFDTAVFTRKAAEIKGFVGISSW